MLLLIAALLVTSSFCEASTDCSESSHSACKDLMKTTEFPQTPEELDAICEYTRQFMACSIEHEENCGKDANVLNEMNKANNLLERTCNKELHLYSPIADNLVCIKKSIFRVPCDLGSEEEVAEFEDKLTKQGIHLTMEDENYAGRCMSHMFSLACRAAKLGNECGETVRDAVTEILQSVAEAENVCSEEIINQLPAIVRILQEYKLREEVEESLEE